MSTNSKIEWTDRTLNIVTGCTKVSSGCLHCYIDRTPPLRMAGRKFDKPGIGGTIPLVFHLERLKQVVRATKPQRWFVNSLADLFHDDVPRDTIVLLWAAMALAPEQTFQILTKRPARMRSMIADECKCGSGHMDGIHFRSAMAWAVSKANPDRPDWAPDDAEQRVYSAQWPLRNVWLGTSVEDQDTANLRIPSLLRTPAAVRFLSCEPLLGPVNLIGQGGNLVGAGIHALPDPPEREGDAPACQDHGIEECSRCRFVDWVIVGGESGPGARPMHPDWARSLRDQCEAASVPYLFKQWGAWAPTSYVGAGTTLPNLVYVPDSTVPDPRQGRELERMGKHAAGRELDGRTHDAYPVPATV